jgi:alkanesulfonate monooxygenase SsuD/methylene tetrahydromethanopterin reductase-like flavin-dependent oxidoreductase (luciferase family)
MNIGIGLPPVADPVRLVDWATCAERGPFRTVAMLDRLAYDNPDPLITLALLAAATERVRVQTEVLIAPVYRTTTLAKQAATLDRLSGGRFTLGIGVGGNPVDYAAAGVDVHTRGRRLDEQMTRMRAIWSGSADAPAIGPAPARTGGPEVLFGGFVDAVVERVGRLGDGFLGAALPPPVMAHRFAGVRDAWQRHGRAGSPRLVAQVNAALGPPALLDAAHAELRRYYGDNPWVDHILDGLVTTPERVRAAVAAYGDIGADEVMFYCWAPDPEQVERLAEAL